MGQLGCCARRGGFEEEDEEEVSEIAHNTRERTPKEQFVYTVRHGEREDAVDDNWVKLSDRPYDPPLTADGRQQAKEVATKLLQLPRNETPNVVISSPYIRCLQTAAIIYHELKKGSSDEVPIASKIIVHHDLSEVQEPRTLSSTVRPEFEDDKVEAAVLTVLKGLAEDGVFSESDLPNVVVHGIQPPFPESHRQANARYDHAFTDILPSSRQNTVLVTHGIAIGRSITSLSPNSVVYKANYCSFTTRKSATPSSPWVLTSTSGENGCTWSDDIEE
eukprot:TRINITY_DN12200_c0_g1_i1.p1 TRINITY_DN12200_c0_g1~~TRINITY_DN12200_c0_g1_i1.p1  ORF type:complete len:289 (+),score=52.79 TRINITY_DN12200_c0_g1_i1:41-868(+)